MKYDPIAIENKWQKIWVEKKLYQTDLDSKKKKHYALVMFPYPSSDKLHIGHWYNFGPADTHARYMRMKGYNVLEPIGFDAFGLPAENYAVKTGIHPTKTTADNVQTMIKQLSRIGTMYDWSKTVNTSTPEYYRWTQWLFLQMYKHRLAYRKKSPVNWCPSCKTVLANEQVWDGKCERCDSEVVQKDLTQWFWKMSAYAEQLLQGHAEIDWPEKTKLMQKNWIGKSSGVTYRQKIKGMDIEFEAYDSVPQTFMAQTFAVIAPEHPMLPAMVAGTKYEKPVMAFSDNIIKKKLANKYATEAELDGIFTGRYVENPFGTGDLPIWVASFVLVDYGSGIVNCSAHDERDFAFAKKYDIPLRPVMFPLDPKEAKKVKNLEYCYHHAPEGIIEQPTEFKSRQWKEARDDIINYIEKKGFGKRTTNYKLRDWLISRQRYWGAPIPIVYCKDCGEVPVPEKDLPVVLPKDVAFQPRGDGKSPLASSASFVNTTCPQCNKPAERETDTMDTFVCSSFYFLRYLDHANTRKLCNTKLVKQWMPVDLYIGGPEHACMHLIYARFVTMVLRKLGYASHGEPFKKLVHQGLITHKGAKMSKSKGNVVSPDPFVEKYGSDVFRMYLMFLGPFTGGGDWNDKGISGIARFSKRMWNYVLSDAKAPHAESDHYHLLHDTHRLIKKVTNDLEIFHFNTAIAAFMEFLNNHEKNGVPVSTKKILVQLLAPFAPHLSEELWERLGEPFSVFNSSWPMYDEKLTQHITIELVVQVNGKIRAKLQTPADISEAEAKKQAYAHDNVKAHVRGKNIVKEIFVKGKLLNIVAR